ncbi:MAG: hypothetical protein HQL46_16500, partial [Gammaproteobacteria bacterium]|nr:hypothetical protein [Gammaproteobacteria bacterium]
MNQFDKNTIVVLLILPLSLFFVVTGVLGLINNLSPDEIDNIIELTR